MDDSLMDDVKARTLDGRAPFRRLVAKIAGHSACALLEQYRGTVAIAPGSTEAGNPNLVASRFAGPDVNTNRPDSLARTGHFHGALVLAGNASNG